MYFYLIVVLIAILFFSLIVVYLNYNISNALTSSVYPPVKNACPDFWSADASGRCIVPSITVPDGNWGTFTSAQALSSNTPLTYGYMPASANQGVEVIDFNNRQWGNLGATSLCQQKQWANNYGIMWDGVSNYTGSC